MFSCLNSLVALVRNIHFYDHPKRECPIFGASYKIGYIDLCYLIIIHGMACDLMGSAIAGDCAGQREITADRSVITPRLAGMSQLSPCLTAAEIVQSFEKRACYTHGLYLLRTSVRYGYSSCAV